MSNWTLFKRSIARHPGLVWGYLWPLMVLGAIYSRPDATKIPFDRALLVTAIVGILPWFPILITAWTLRHQYKDEDEQR